MQPKQIRLGWPYRDRIVLAQASCGEETGIIRIKDETGRLCLIAMTPQQMIDLASEMIEAARPMVPFLRKPDSL